MQKGFFLTIISVNLLWCCTAQQIKKNVRTQIRVVNRTEISFTNISLFSMPFKDLGPTESSTYKPFRYNPLKQDGLIYCMNGEDNHARYLKIPGVRDGRITYSIDSLRNDIIYVSYERNP
nr:hypothetical protein [uncultured Allomuricauda sp.]